MHIYKIPIFYIQGGFWIENKINEK
jgi:hypothetical protein